MGGGITCNDNLQLSRIESEGMQRGTGDQIIPVSQRAAWQHTQVLAGSSLKEAVAYLSSLSDEGGDRRRGRLKIISHNKEVGKMGAFSLSYISHHMEMNAWVCDKCVIQHILPQFFSFFFCQKVYDDKNDFMNEL